MRKFIFASAMLLVSASSALAETDNFSRLAKFSDGSVAASTKAVDAPSRKSHPRATHAPNSSIHAMVTEVALQHGISPALAHAIVTVESRYNCNARGGNARGIMQVLPRTASGVGVTGNLYDCRTGLTAGMRYLKQAIAAYGSGCAGASAYNTGIYKTGRCTGYGRKVLALARGMETRTAGL